MPRAKAKTTTTEASKPPAIFSSIDPATLPRRYHLKVTGDCMAPAIKDGMTVIGTKERAKPHELVLIFWKPEAVSPANPPVSLKELVVYAPLDNVARGGNVAPCLIVKQANPPKMLKVNLAAVAAVHLCLGPVRSDRPSSRGQS
jgi:hypothetical protein